MQQMPPNSYLTLFKTQRSLDRLAEGWRALEDNCKNPLSVFQSFAWNKTWSEIYISPESETELFIIAGFSDDKLVFIWPLMKERRRGANIISWLSQPVGQYGDLLCHKDHDSEQWTQAAIAYMKSQPKVDCLHLRHVRKSSNFGTYAEKHFYDGRLRECAPAMDLTPFKSESDYDARYDSQQRKRRKRIRKRLEDQMGLVSYDVIAPGPELDQAIADATHEKLIWLKDRGRFNKVLHCQTHQILLQKLSRLENSNLNMVAIALNAGGNPVGWEFSFRYRDIHFCYITSHRFDLTEAGTGRLMLDLSQRLALKDGLKGFDLMVPYDQHKDSFASEMEVVNDHYLPLSAKGALYAHAYIGFFRPLARRIYHRLPIGVLRTIKKLIRN